MDLILFSVALWLFIGIVVVALALPIVRAFRRERKKYDSALRYFGPKDRP